MSRAVAEWVKIAKDAGWRVEATKRNHLRFMAPNGGIVHIGSHHGHASAYANAKAQLRKGGLVFPDDAKNTRRLETELGLFALETGRHMELPAIARDGAKPTEQDVYWNVQQQPLYHQTIEAMDELEGEDQPSGLVEVDIATERGESMKNEIATNGSSDDAEVSKAADARNTAAEKRDRTLLLIHFGKRLHAIEGVAGAVPAIVSLLEDAVLLELSAADVLEAIKS